MSGLSPPAREAGALSPPAREAGALSPPAREAGALTDDRPLAGFTIAITADRRRDELAALLERRGARVMFAPALRIVPIADDVRLRECTEELVRRPPTIAVADTPSVTACHESPCPEPLRRCGNAVPRTRAPTRKPIALPSPSRYHPAAIFMPTG